MNPIKQKNAFPVVGIVSVVFSLFIGLFLFLAMRTDFVPDIGHFAHNSTFVYCFIGGCAGAVLLAVYAAIAEKKEAAVPSVQGEAFACTLVSYAAALCGAVLFAAELMEISQAERTPMSSIMNLGELVTLPGFVLFFALAGIPSLRGGTLHTASAIGACLAVNFMMFKGYFDFTLPLNSPIRNALTVMEAAFLLYLLSETRLLLGRSGGFRGFARVAAASLTVGISFGLLLTAWIVPDLLPSGVSVLCCLTCLVGGGKALLGLFMRRN